MFALPTPTSMGIPNQMLTPQHPQVPSGGYLGNFIGNGVNDIKNIVSGLPNIIPFLSQVNQEGQQIRNNNPMFRFLPPGIEDWLTPTGQNAIGTIGRQYNADFGSPVKLDENKNITGIGLPDLGAAWKNFTTHPVRTALDVLPVLQAAKAAGVAGDLGEAGNIASKAGEAGDAAETAGEAGNAYRIPTVAKAAEGEIPTTANTARNIIAPKVGGNAIGSLSKEQIISQDVLNATKSLNDTGIAKDIESIYGKVNSALDKTLSSASDKIGPLPVNLNEPGNLVDTFTQGLENTEAGGDPSMLASVRHRVEGFFRPQTASPDEASFTTTIEGVNNARQQINNILDPWYKRGSPMVSPQDYQNALLAHVKDNINSFMADQVPEARELVNAQSRLIPAYQGIYRQLTPSASNYVPLRPYSIMGHALGSVINPLQILMSRNPGSEFATRLSELIGGEAPQAANLSLPVNALPSLPFLNFAGNTGNSNFGQ